MKSFVSKIWSSPEGVSKAGPEEIKYSWQNGFTDPKQHDNQRYRYLVHGVLASQVGRVEQMIFLAKMHASFSADANVDLLKFPNDIHKKPIISTSVISEAKNSTYGNGGFILETPFENILATHYQDRGTDFSNPDKVKSQKQRISDTVETLLNKTASASYNEVVLAGKTEQGRVIITGVWYGIDESGKASDPELAEKLKAIARRNQIPVIEIKQKVSFQEIDYGGDVAIAQLVGELDPYNFPYENALAHLAKDPFNKDKPSFFYVHRWGTRYLFRLESKEVVAYKSPNSESRKLSAEEFERVKKIMLEELQGEDKALFEKYLPEFEKPFQ